MGAIQDRNSKIHHAKQQYIVDSTLKLIGEIGIDNLTMDNIAVASDYTKRTLYSYFKSKDEILLWVFTDDLKQRWNYQKKQLVADKTGIKKLRIWATSLYDYCIDNNQSFQIQNYMDYHFVDLDKIGKPIIANFEEINDELAQGLRDLMSLGKKDGSIAEELESDITISQFLFSYRAILKRALSDKYSFIQINQRGYVDHFLYLFLKSLS